MLIKLPKAIQCVSGEEGGGLESRSPLLNLNLSQADFLSLPSSAPNGRTKGPPLPAGSPHLAFSEEKRPLISIWGHLVSKAAAGGLVLLWIRFGKLPAAERARPGVSQPPAAHPSGPLGFPADILTATLSGVFLCHPGPPEIWGGKQPLPRAVHTARWQCRAPVPAPDSSSPPPPPTPTRPRAQKLQGRAAPGKDVDPPPHFLPAPARGLP